MLADEFPSISDILRRDRVRQSCEMDDAVIDRAEVAALLFNVSDIARSVERIEALLGGDDEEEEADEN